MKKKLPAKYNVVAVPFCLSFVMSGVVSLAALVKGIGLVDGLLWIWLPSWGFSWCVAFPTVFFVLPLVRRFVGNFVEKAGH